jgi:hypothetical protein
LTADDHVAQRFAARTVEVEHLNLRRQPATPTASRRFILPDGTSRAALLPTQIAAIFRFSERLDGNDEIFNLRESPCEKQDSNY